MAKRLEILLDDAEYAAIEEAARRQGISVSDWVRHMLRDAPRYERDRAERKRKALERARSTIIPPPTLTRCCKISKTGT